jgi:hypothetical protein
MVEETYRDRVRRRIRQWVDEGRIETLRGVLLTRLEREASPPNPELRRQVETCSDPDTLMHWCERFMDGASVDEALSA